MDIMYSSWQIAQHAILSCDFQPLNEFTKPQGTILSNPGTGHCRDQQAGVRGSSSAIVKEVEHLLALLCKNSHVFCHLSQAHSHATLHELNNSMSWSMHGTK